MDTNTDTPTTFVVNATLADRIVERVDALNDRIKRMGLDGGWAVTLGELIPVKDEVFGHTIGYDREVIVTGTEPKLPGGWAFVGTIDHDVQGSGQNIVNVFDETVDTLPLRDAAPTCDHCGHNRDRRMTILARNTDGDIVRVGRNCAKDFLGYRFPGGSIPSLRDLDADLGGPLSIPIGVFLTNAVLIVDTFGYHKADSDSEPTGDLVWGYSMNPGAKSLAYVRDALAERNADAVAAEAKAAKVLAWVRDEADTTSDYIHNLSVACAADYVDARRKRLVASAVVAYDRQMGFAAERAARKAAQAEKLADAGPAPEGRHTVEGTVVGFKTYDGQWGTTYKMRVMLDDGNVVFGTVPKAIDSASWDENGNRLPTVEVDDRVKFTATFVRSDDDEHFARYNRPSKASFEMTAEHQAEYDAAVAERAEKQAEADAYWAHANAVRDAAKQVNRIDTALDFDECGEARPVTITDVDVSDAAIDTARSELVAALEQFDRFMESPARGGKGDINGIKSTGECALRDLDRTVSRRAKV